MLTRYATSTPKTTRDASSPTLMRSVTPSPGTPSKLRDRIPLPHKLVKSSSSTDIGTHSNMAAAVAMPRTFGSTTRSLMSDPDHVMDTRTPSPVQRNPSVDSAGTDYKPDLSQEVAMLSTKLVNAINYQTTLDDNLQHTRHELETERAKSARIAAEKKSLDDMIAQGLLVRKGEVDKHISRLKEELQQERLARQEAEKAKKQTEGELETLTSALFEEANTMVAAARRDTEAAEKRNTQLRSQLNDTDVLLQSQQEQLRDLKGTMERLSERGDAETSGPRDGSMPSTPIDKTHTSFDHFSPDSTAAQDFNPEHPLHFSQLLQPVMRNDIQAYTEFVELLATARRAAPHSRTGSGAHQPTSTSAASSNQSNLPSAFTGQSPSLPGAFSFSNSSPTSSPSGNLPPLKESKFYKRALSEDVEPCLRLDLAPGLSFLSRRSVLSSLLSGTLIVEPFTPQHKFYGPVFSCALCGEGRKQEPYVRKHRFRTSESEDAQRYSLCDYCLGRIRSVGDFVGFLRMVRDGHWRCEKEEDEKGAWEESVRLRERMFWARLGGGVVPALMQQHVTGHTGLERQNSTKAIKSARQSLESVPEERQGRGTEDGRVIAKITTAADGEIRDDAPPSAEAKMKGDPESAVIQQLLTSSSSIAATPSGRNSELSISQSTSQQTNQGDEEKTDKHGPTEQYMEAEGTMTDEFATPATEKSEPDMAAALQSSKQGSPASLSTSVTIDGALGDSQRTTDEAADTTRADLVRSLTNESTGTQSEASTTSLRPNHEGHERRPSSVLDRVRAMEAKATGRS